MTFEPRQFNADRICEAISKIGYKFHAAIEDIVDNSVSANASNIQVLFELQEGATLTEKNKVVSITIIDDGIGMDEQGVNTALDLGSDITYASGSLSKYGLGLKSAGFSLGKKISVYSKKDGVLTSVKVLDRDIIREKNAYGIVTEELENNLLEDKESGTVVKISKINLPHDSLNKTLKILKSRMGVLYNQLILENGINIQIVVGENNHEIEPKDILFLEKVVSGFDVDTYDAKSPCLVLDQDIELEGCPNVNVKAVVFPMATMKSYPGFSKEDQEQISDYDISKPNSGFFIFRNNRLIKWGDNLEILNRDAINLRGYISINTEHDDMLHVDVSKQNLVLSEQFLDALDMAFRRPVKQAEEARKYCSSLLKLNNNNEGEKMNETLQLIAEEDPDDLLIPENKEETTKRRKAKVERSVIENKDDENKETDEPDNEGKMVKKDVFEKVRYSDNLRHELYKSGFDPTYGAYVKINKNHAFYDVYLNSLPAADKSRIAIEALFWAMATAEAITEEKLQSVEQKHILEVFNKFQRTASYNLETWVVSNQELIE
ncbi:ATP-binding protein [Acinetobacter venetianus]|uniref:Histidine kinase-, DNA gyrase B-, and HSP90-like ATPase n=1 Tax=Acinetobacter venetianus TaxID=52133 RepID=A0A150HPW2_9GAMM|nr:ATP-binding protein [Acinetobacter venetianus]KXZ68560.1 Histidine kinase-, DNA gyrase B-, and HSP90-like ATPase [Acinetobacter venetianus]